MSTRSYTLNATVDAKLAKKRPPLPITSVTAPFYSSVTEKLPAISQYLPTLPYFSSSPSKQAAETKAAKKPSLLRLPSGIEVGADDGSGLGTLADGAAKQMSGPEGEERLQGSRAERRLNALNPHGNIDFVLPSGGVSEYLGESARCRLSHAQADRCRSQTPSRAMHPTGPTRILGRSFSQVSQPAGIHSAPAKRSPPTAEIFSKKLDMLRTGMGLANPSMVPEDIPL